MEESAKVASTMYALPRRLRGLGRDDVRVLIRSTADQLGHSNLTPTHIKDIADRADRIDADGHPLFIQVATMGWLHMNAGGGGRDDALRRLIARSASQMHDRIGNSSLAMLARNVQVFTTALGGLTIEDYADLSRRPPLPANLLPDVFQVLGSVTLDDLVDGMRPDIIGELFVLDQLDTYGTTRLATTTLLRHAFHSNLDAYQGFVERAAADHTEHPRLLDLLIASVSDESPAVSAELAVAVIPLLKRSGHPAITWIFDQLACVRDRIGPDRIGQLLATARFRFANLVFGEGDMHKAFELLTQALAQCNPTWPQYGNILNNRGATLVELGESKAAIADFSAVIDAAAASNEARACALNNRADVLFSDGDVAGAIADRSAVLVLTDTTYDRRYIALARRAVALRRLGDEAWAYQDIETILATSDIAVEQKMAARLMRAEWLLQAGDITEAQPDLDCILASYRNFDYVEQKARKLRTPQAANG